MLYLGCARTPSVEVGVPRSPAAAVARLEGLGWRASCEGGVLGDEVSIACTATGPQGRLLLDAVTTGAPLPAPPDRASALVEDLWIEARLSDTATDTFDPVASQRCITAFAGH